MDYPRDIKIMVLLLGFLAACSGKQHTKVSNAGYNYNRGQGHNKILKAVLVHESTGQGLHSGTVSGSNGNFKITEQSGDRAISGYSYPARQKLKPNLGATDTRTIRVFHESTGNTGNILRNSNPSHSQKGASIIKQNPAQTLRYIHENALSRSRSDQNFIDRSRSLSSPGPAPIPINSGNGGYQYDTTQNLGNADNVYGAPRQAEVVGYQSENSGNVVNTGSFPSGYQYQSPNQAVSNGNDNGINPLQAAIVSISKAQSVSLGEIVTGTGQIGSNGYQYARPIQALNINSGNGNSYLSSSEAQHTKSSGYQYHNQGIITSSAFGSISNENPQNTLTGPNQAISLSNTAGISSNGYQYRPPFQPLSVDHGSEGSPNQAQSLNQGSSEYESAQAANGYQYPNKGFGNENAQNIFSTLSQPQNVNLQHTPTGSGQTILNINGGYNTSPQSGGNLQLDNSGIITNNGYRCDSQGGIAQTAIPQYSTSSLSPGNQVYPNLPENIGTLGGYQYADQSAQGGHQTENLRADGYHYQKSNEHVGYQDSQAGQIQSPGSTQFEQNGQSENAGYPFNGFVQALKSSHHSEQPKEEGYRYEQPEAAKSVFKGQPYLPLPLAPKYSSPQPDGYSYDKPDESSRPQTTFKGQPYLPLPPVSGGR